MILGYGFSDPSAKEGMNFIQVARIFKELMRRLEHKTFYTQAGDWGAAITAALAILYPENVLGYHTNFATIQTPGAMLKSHLSSHFPAMFGIPEEEQWMIKDLGNEFKVCIEKNI